LQLSQKRLALDDEFMDEEKPTMKVETDATFAAAIEEAVAAAVAAEQKEHAAEIKVSSSSRQ
jgi:hypothetical protein